MPASYRIDPERRLISSRGTGVLTGDDLRSHQRKLLADGDFDPSYDQLWDFSDVEEVEVARQDLRALAQSRSFEPGARRAIVAPRDLQYGLARMFQTLHEDAPEELRVFRSRDEARAWLAGPRD